MADLALTTVCVLTPTGRGAVAVVAVEGPSATEFVERRFRPRRQPGLRGRPVGAIVYGQWGDDPTEDVIVCRRDAGVVEVHCHGGLFAARRIVEDLTTTGAQEEPWQEWLLRHEPNVIRAAARIALAAATTERTASILLDQFHGALENHLRRIVDALSTAFDTIPHLETKRHCSSATKLIEQLLERANLGLHLTQPWRVVIAGPPNVGKSSLINALLGFTRAIVFDQPGTTRDVVTALTALDGWPVELADTAGLRSSSDPLESAGVSLAWEHATAADCLVLVFDASQPWTPQNQQLIETWPKAILVHNKCDLGALSGEAPPGNLTSAVTGQGMNSLMASIVKYLVSIELKPGDAVPFTIEQVGVLQAALGALQNGEVAPARDSLLALLR